MSASIILIAIVLIGMAFYRRSARDESSTTFFLGAKNSGALQLTLSLSATWIGMASLIALSGWVKQFGSSAIWYLLFPGIGLMLTGIFGVDIIRARKGVALFDYYDNRYFKIIFSAFLAFLYIMLLAAQLAGFAKLSNVLGVSYTFGLLSAGLIIGVYTSIGGFDSVRDTDGLQFILIVTSIVLLFMMIPYPVQMPDLSNVFTPLDGLPLSLFLLYVSLGLGMFVAQDNHQRIKAAKSANTAKIACFFAGLIVMCFGLIVATLSATVPTEGGNPTLEALAKLAPLWLAIIAVGFMCAALSTADTALHICSYSLMNLFPSQSRIKSYLSVAIGTISGLMVAYTVPSIGKIILICINFYVGAAFPIIVSVLLNRPQSTIIAVGISTIVVVASGYYLGFSAPGLLGIATGFILMIISYLYWIAKYRVTN